MSNFQEIYNRIKKAKNILILTHQIPDGDAIGSALALYLIVNKLNISVDIAVTNIPKFANELPNHEKLLTEVKGIYDLIILVDVSSKTQLGVFDYLFDEQDKLIIIDHHNVEISNDMMHYVNHDASSATMVLYDFIKENNIDLDYDLALCLYTGLITDTGGFMHQNTKSETFLMAADLLTKGLNHNEIYLKLMKPDQPIEYLLLQKNVIENLEIINNKVAFSFLNNEALEKYQCDNPEGFVNIGRQIENVKASILIMEEQPNNYRVSLRSKNDLDVSLIARKFGGGGHKQSSGFRFGGNFEETKTQLIEEIIKKLEQIGI